MDEPEPAESDVATTVSMPTLRAAKDSAEEGRPSDETSDDATSTDANSGEAGTTEPASDDVNSDEATSADVNSDEATSTDVTSDEATPEADESGTEVQPGAEVQSDREKRVGHEEPVADEVPANGHEDELGSVPSAEPRASGIASSVWLEPEEGRSRRSVLRAVAALAIAVVSAVALGLLIVVFSDAVGGGSSKKGTTPPALTLPTGPVKAPTAATPADWVQQTDNQGIVFRAPPGWTERADSRIDYRVEPSPTGPGVSQVGIGLVTGTTDPDAAATSYASATYAGQPGYVQQPATDQVSARGERGRQVVVDYTRSGTPVDVVIRAFPTARGVLLVVSRAAVADDQRAVRLADALDASVRLP